MKHFHIRGQTLVNFSSYYKFLKSLKLDGRTDSQVGRPDQMADDQIGWLIGRQMARWSKLNPPQEARPHIWVAPP